MDAFVTEVRKAPTPVMASAAKQSSRTAWIASSLRSSQ
jgi:hypothetical protein